MTKQTISAVILTHNEEDNIEHALNSIEFCDEIIIIDDNSTDKTIDIANKYKAKVYQRAMNNDFSSQRNFAITKAKGDWILFIDADEQAGDELKKEILNLLHDSNNKISAYYIKRRDFWWGRELKYGETSKVRNTGLIRLIKQNSGQWQYNVHEAFHLHQSLFSSQLKSYLDHYSHPKLKDFIREINLYSTLRARQLLKENKQTNILEIIFFPFGKFLLNYFLKLGFLDGPAGFAYAFMMSFHSFLVRAKLYQYSHDK